MIATETRPETKPAKRPATPGICPGCNERVEVRGSSHRCGGCGLVAPRSAYTLAPGSSNVSDGTDPRAWTISGRVD
jgi:hypothetical protein